MVFDSGAVLLNGDGSSSSGISLCIRAEVRGLG
jgi:hypothetical protein